MHRSLTVAALLLTSAAAAQPDVPAGFVVRRMLPLIDGEVPQLEAMDDESFGEGVITAAADSGVATVRLIRPSGQVDSLATVTGLPSNASVLRARHDRNDQIDGNIHISVITPGAGTQTFYFTITPEEVVDLKWISGGASNELAYDLLFVPQPQFNGPVKLVDFDIAHGSTIARMSSTYELVLENQNAVPAGRVDTDVQGMQFDATGFYGSAVVLADSDDNSELSTIWSLSPTNQFTALTVPVDTSIRQYGDIALSPVGVFGSILYATERISDEIQQVAPNGTHTTWATGFVGIDSLSISPDGESMYVADLNGVWLIRPEGNEPGPAVLASDPSVPSGSAISGAPVNALRVIFTEPVSFTDADVTITNSDGQPVGFDASGSGSQFMIIGLATPLSGDTYTVTIADSLTSVATAQPLDGDNDGVAGADATLTFTHACEGDIADDFGIAGSDGMVSFGDFLRMLSLVGPCP